MMLLQKSLAFLSVLASFSQAASTQAAKQASGQASSGSSSSSQRACNNFPELCDKSYADIAHLGAHDSPFVRTVANGFTDSGNQYFDSVTQLDAGVRLLTGQIHPKGNQLHLCHSDCDLLDAGTLASWLTKIRQWMDNHPDDVVTILIVNSADASASELDAQFKQAGIDKYGYVPPNKSQALAKWPTLNQMLSNNKRMVSFIASLDPAQNTVAPYLLDEFTFVFENKFGPTNAAEFDCNPDRPEQVTPQQEAKTNRLFLMNHFLDKEISPLSITIPNEGRIGITNSIKGGQGAFGTHASQCTQTYKHVPTFNLVDFVNVGPAIDTVDLLNGVNKKTPVNRKTLFSKPGPPPLTNAAPSRAELSMVLTATLPVLAALWI